MTFKRCVYRRMLQNLAARIHLTAGRNQYKGAIGILCREDHSFGQKFLSFSVVPGWQ